MEVKGRSPESRFLLAFDVEELNDEPPTKSSPRMPPEKSSQREEQKQPLAAQEYKSPKEACPHKTKEIVDYVFLSQNGIAHEEVDIIHRLCGGQHAENEYVSFRTGTQQHTELC